MFAVTEGKYVFSIMVYVPGKSQQVAQPQHTQKKKIHGLGLAVNWRSQKTLPIPGKMSHHGKNETGEFRISKSRIKDISNDPLIFSPPSLTSEEERSDGSRSGAGWPCFRWDNGLSEAIGADESGLILRVMHVNVTGTARLPTGALWDYLSQNICILPSENG